MNTLFALGFRPLYLLAGAFASLSILGWSGLFAGWVPAGYLHGSSRWHAHEMIFGYTFAVIVGFLFTAGSNWTRQPTPSGGRLVAICGAWILARTLALTDLPSVRSRSTSRSRSPRRSVSASPSGARATPATTSSCS
jgi:uncharacterized protein involved in response to NO